MQDNNFNYPISTPILKGYHSIEAIWFPFMWFSPQQCAEFILQYWIKNCETYLFEQGYLLRFPHSVRLYCDQVDGWPLANIDGKLCSMILSHSVESPKGDILLLIGNQLESFFYQNAKLINPASWLTIDDYILLDIKPLSIEITELEFIDPIPDAKDVADIYGSNIATPSSALLKFVNDKRQKSTVKKTKQQEVDKQKTENTIKEQMVIDSNRAWAVGLILIGVFFLYRLTVKWKEYQPVHHYSKKSLLNFIPTVPWLVWIIITIAVIIIIVAIVRWIKGGSVGYIMRKIATSVVKPKYNGSVHQPIARSNKSTLMDQKQDKAKLWQRILKKLPILNKLSQFFAFRQDKYLESMIKLFEEGNFDEALKYAIPINADEEDSRPTTLGSFKPRNKLSFSKKVYGQGAAIPCEPETQYRISQLYQKSFEELAKKNRIDEAAFVMIELLNNVTKGIEYLEQNKRYQQALDIAITKDADPNIIVRLCCLTQQWDKAIMIAKQYNSFANSVMLLEQHDSAIAEKLRLIWANTLAERGEWVTAIDVIWPLVEYRYLAEKWFEYAEKMAEFSGSILVKKLILCPDSLAYHAHYLETLQIDPDRYEERAVIALAILQNKQERSKLKPLLAALIHAIIADSVQYSVNLSRVNYIDLVNYCNDQALKMDLSPFSQINMKVIQPLNEDPRHQVITCSASGYRIIYDAVPIRNGHLLLALGDAGIIIVDKMGIQLKHFMIAAHTIVLSYNLSQVLLLAQRDDVFHIHKLDLATEQWQSLGYLKLVKWAKEFDGFNWTVLVNNCIQVINIENTLKIGWKVELEEYAMTSIASSSKQEKWLLKNTSNGSFELWHYELPSRRLKDRSILSNNEGVFLNRNNKNCYFRYSALKQTVLLKFNWQTSFHELGIVITESQYNNMLYVMLNDFIVITIKDDQQDDWNIYIYHLDSNSIKMTIKWPKINKVAMRSTESLLLLWDHQGRCAKLDVLKNQVLHFAV